jgi:predicted nucleotidyltransferase
MEDNNVNKRKIMEILHGYKKEIAEQYGILDIGVFGSAARGEIHDESDVDVVVRVIKPDLFLLVGIKDELEKRLHRPVDIVTYRENMNQFLKDRIDSEAIYT